MAKRAVVAGATGLVGKHLTEILLQQSFYDEVHVLVRKKLEFQYPKLVQHKADWKDLNIHKEIFPSADVFCCLGTTIKKAGSKEAFKYVDLELVEKLAIAASAAGAEKFLLVTAMGADKNSRIFYNKTKGEAEETVKKFPFKSIHIFRPSMLLGEREESRPMERLGQIVMKKLSFLFAGPLKPYAAIEAEDVARAIAGVAEKETSGNFTYSSDKIQKLANTKSVK